MPKERTIEREVSGYISTLLRQHFGKGPTSIYVVVKQPFITIHFRGFTTAIEKILLKQGEWKRVLETRNLLIEELKPMIRQHLDKIGGWTIEKFYVDWNLELETGTILGIMDEQPDRENFPWPKQFHQAAFEKKLEELQEKATCRAAEIDCYWINERTLLVQWTGVLSPIEKALIQEGYSEVLKFTKKPLERSWLENAGFETVLQQDIQEIFLEWDFDADKGFIVFLLYGKKNG